MEETEQKKIHSFTDLIAWKKAHSLVLMIYRITNEFPKSETFGLTNQIRRSAVSITSNIAEGFSRATNKNKSQFYAMSLGSLTELQSQLLIARDVGYVSKENFMTISALSVEVSKLLNGLRKIRNT